MKVVTIEIRESDGGTLRRGIRQQVDGEGLYPERVANIYKRLARELFDVPFGELEE